MSIEALIAQAVAAAQAPVLAKLQELLDRAPAPAADEYLTIDEAAALVKYDRKTVTKWIHQGKYNAKGKLIFLEQRQFAAGEYRIHRTALEMFGQGIGVSVPPVAKSQGGKLVQMHPARPPKKSSFAPTGS